MEIIPSQEQALAESHRPQLAELAERFIGAQDVAPSSRSTYGRQLRQFTEWLVDTGRAGSLSSLQREDILAYKRDLQDSGRSSYTVAGYLTAVRKLFEWLEGEKIYPNIARGVKGPRKPRGFRKDCLTPEQLREALEAMDRDRVEGLRNYAIFNLMARTGLRDVEVSRAQVGDIRQEAGQVVLWVRGKGRDTKDDFVILLEEAHKPIREYLALRGTVEDQEPLFSSLSDRNRGQGLSTRTISGIVKRALRRIGLDSKRLTAHSLRHTAITLAAAGGASLEQTQAMARHTDPKTTQIYFHNLARLQAGAEKYISF